MFDLQSPAAAAAAVAHAVYRIALCLLKDQPGELLRRLSIICVEDALLHPALPLVVWLMAAQVNNGRGGETWEGGS
jgi:hypothetical protein